MSFDLAQFAASSQTLLAPVQRDEVFGFVTRSVRLPPGVSCSVVDASSHARWVHSGQVHDEDVAELRFVRTGPFTVQFELGGFHTLGGQDLRLELSVQLEVDLRSGGLEQLVSRLGRQRIRVEMIRTALEPAVRSSVEKVSSQRPVSELLGQPDGWLAVVRQMLEAPAFEIGVRVLKLTAGSIRSDVYQQQLREKARGQLEADRLEMRNQLARLKADQRAAELSSVRQAVAKVRDLAASSPGLTLPDLLKGFSGDLRNAMYEGLLASQTGGQPGVQATAEQARALASGVLVVTSERLLLYRDGLDPRELVLPEDLGSPRSCAVSGRGFLVGAQKGVWRLSADLQVLDALHARAAGDLKGGFNAALQAGAGVLATHSELGVWWWNDDDGLAKCLQAPSSRRVHSPVLLSDGQLGWAADSELWLARFDEAPRRLPMLPGICSSLAADGLRLLVGMHGGQVLLIDTDEPGERRSLTAGHGRPIRRLCVANLGGVERVVISDSGPSVIARVIDDHHSTDYRCRRGIRDVRADSLRIVGVDELRSVLVVWSAGQPADPVCEVDVRSVAGRSIQDFVLL